jgi:hypothetical protein
VYDWIDNNKSYPFCKLCNTTTKGGNFHLRRHANNLSHIKHVNAAKKCIQISQALFTPPVQKEHQLIKEAELRLCAYVCDKNLSLLLMDTLPLFNKAIYSDSKIAQNIKMKRKKATQLIVGVMAPSFRKEICEDLKSTNFSIIIDETTDIGTKKSLAKILEKRLCAR